MKKNISPFKIMCCCLLSAAWITLSHAKSLNLILSDNDEFQVGQGAGLLNQNQLIFNRLNGSESQAWVYNTDTGTMTGLDVNDVNKVIVFKGLAYIFSENFPGYFSVYTSDGTPAGTELLVTGIQHHETSQQAIYFISYSNGQSFTVSKHDGNVLSQQTFNGSWNQTIAANNSICELNSETYVVLSTINDSRNRPSHTNLNSSMGESLRVSNSTGNRAFRLQSLDEMCLLSSYKSEVLQITHKVNSTGVIETIATDPFVRSIRFTTAWSEVIYALTVDSGEAKYRVHQLNASDLNSIRSIEVPTERPLDNFTDPFLIATESGLIGQYQNTYHINFDLTAISLLPDISASQFAIRFHSQVTNTEQGTVVYNPYPYPFWSEYETQNIPDVLVFNSDQSINSFKSTEQWRIDHVAVQTDQLILNAFDFETQKKGLYLLQNKPTIGRLINGAWYNETLARQGLSISKGTRQNGSEYIFLTAYLYRDGAPFWLVGTGELSNGLDQLSVSLSAYEGPDFLQPGQPATAESFGEMTLSLLDCDVLEAEFINPIESQTIVFYRADNTYFNFLCQ